MGSTSVANASSNTAIQAWLYRYDEAGNLRGRKRYDGVDGMPADEEFTYDSLNRLTTSTIDISSSTPYHASEGYEYDLIGNIKKKGGQTYTYGTCGAGPHAVCQVTGGSSYTYDLNGNMATGGGRTVSFNSINKVSSIDSVPATQGGSHDTVDFVYGADGHRVLEVAATAGAAGNTRTLYVGLGATGRSYYERTKRGNNTTEHVQFIYAGSAHGGNAFALRMQTDDATGTGGSVTLRFNHFDHLGSVTAISDETGQVVGGAFGGPDATTMGYDAWGARRNPDGTAANPASFNLPAGHRGFTGQETIPNVGLINMNGRVYDPILGRFLSPDSQVQFVADMQSYNRYSYVHNNPLSYTDPTGYGLSDMTNFVGFKIFTAVVGVAACVIGFYACVAVGAAVAIINATAAIQDGAAVAPVIGVAVLSVGISAIGGAAGSGLASVGGNTVGAQIAAGAVSGAISAASMDIALNRGNLGEDIMIGALTGAAYAGVTGGIQHLPPVSQAGAQGGGGSGEAKLRQLVTTRDMVGGPGSDETGLSADQETLNSYTKGTRLQGRATIDPVLAGTERLGVTDGLTGQVRILPDAFASDGFLKQVVFHEGVHVDQIMSSNFAAYKGTPASRVNEIEAYRKQLANSLQFSAQDGAPEAARANTMYQLSDMIGAVEGTSHYRQVTSWPYNYTVDAADRCLACSAR